MANENLYQTRSAIRHLRDSGTEDYGPAHNADQVAYDSDASGLTATDVQAAIDEIAGAEASANTYTDDAIAALVGEAPELLDTLGEIAAALGDDENLATTLLDAIGGKADADHNHDSDYAAAGHDHDSDYAALSTAFVVVSHGSTASTARPTGIGAVYWIGSVVPTNAANGDQWYDTTGDS